ncbi:MAG: NADH-quinone oxidoreductase subunit C [Rickettsiales bacterium]|nr:NADH-quinone oxidoreductase subunit C [Rickettsiales bacterium]|tara:strand:+ start:240 stop:917 length:678 start_codon:yes stop_codon:yes gene_type:complete
MMERLENLQKYLKASSFKDQILVDKIKSGELALTISVEALPEIMTFLRDDSECLFKVLVDICGVDYPDREKRFDVVYNLLSLSHNMRLRLKVNVDEEEFVPTVTEVFATATWFEREIWDLYGIPFEGNKDLRRLLTDYGFKGHPLRKDFPLTGYVELRYDEARKKVVYEPVQLTQDFRKFDFLSPWEGMTDVMLPGDEKAVKQKFGTEFLEDDEPSVAFKKEANE